MSENRHRINSVNITYNPNLSDLNGQIDTTGRIDEKLSVINEKIDDNKFNYVVESIITDESGVSDDIIFVYSNSNYTLKQKSGSSYIVYDVPISSTVLVKSIDTIYILKSKSGNNQTWFNNDNVGKKEYIDNVLKGEIFNSYSGENKNTASGEYSHSSGLGTIADQEAMTSIGKYNTSDNTDALFAVGNGTTTSNRSDAFVVKNDGSAVIQNKLNVNDLVLNNTIGFTDNINLFLNYYPIEDFNNINISSHIYDSNNIYYIDDTDFTKIYKYSLITQISEQIFDSSDPIIEQNEEFSIITYYVHNNNIYIIVINNPSLSGTGEKLYFITMIYNQGSYSRTDKRITNNNSTNKKNNLKKNIKSQTITHIYDNPLVKFYNGKLYFVFEDSVVTKNAITYSYYIEIIDTTTLLNTITPEYIYLGNTDQYINMFVDDDDLYILYAFRQNNDPPIYKIKRYTYDTSTNNYTPVAGDYYSSSNMTELCNN